MVVDGRVEAELVHQPTALRGRSGGPDHPGRAEPPGDLARQRADTARRARHQDHVAPADPGDVAHAVQRGRPVGGGQVVLRRGQQGRVEDPRRLDRDLGVLRPRTPVRDQRPDRYRLGPARHDGADGGPGHRLVERVRRYGQIAVEVHPLAHHRGHAQVPGAHEHVAGPRIRDGDLDTAEGVRRQRAVRARHQVHRPGAVGDRGGGTGRARRALVHRHGDAPAARGSASRRSGRAVRGRARSPAAGARRRSARAGRSVRRGARTGRSRRAVRPRRGRGRRGRRRTRC